MLLTTGNKSEMSVGYATLYGDMAGGYSVLKDAYKTTVFALSRWRNANKPEGALGPDGPVMPARVITKPPTRRASPRPEGRGQPAALFGARPHPRRPGRQGNVGEGGRARDRRGRGAGRRHRIASCSRPSTSAARRRRGSRSATATSAATAATRSATSSTPARRRAPAMSPGCGHPLRAVADRPAARRQYPHGAAQLPVRARSTAARSSCASTTPTASARPRSSTRRSATISTGLGSSPTSSSASRSGSTSMSANSSASSRRAGSMPATRRPRSSTLRRKVLLGRGLPPVYERKPADAPVPEGRAPHWRFRLDHDVPIVWNDLIRGEQRFDPEAAQRPGRPPRGRQLALSAAERDRRRRPRHHPRRARRGPCVEQRRADPDVRGARRQAAGVRARGIARRRRGQTVEAPRFLRRRASARGRSRADGAAVGARAHRHVAAGRADRQPRRARGDASTSRPSAARRRISTRTKSSWSMRACSTQLDFAAVADRLPDGATEEDWLLLRAESRARSATSSAWLPVLHGEIDPPELSHDERLLARDAAAVAEKLDWSAEPWRALTDELKRTYRQEGPRAVSPAAPRPHRAARAGPRWPGSFARMGKDRAIDRLEAAQRSANSARAHSSLAEQM